MKIDFLLISLRAQQFYGEKKTMYKHVLIQIRMKLQNFSGKKKKKNGSQNEMKSIIIYNRDQCMCFESRIVRMHLALTQPN